MAAKIGILAESTSVTNASTTTVYTVPADKAARVRLLIVFQSGGASLNYWISIGGPSDETIFQRHIANGEDFYTGFDGAGSQASNTVGLVDAGTGVMPGTNPLAFNGDNNDHIILPYPHDFFLSTGDTVKFRFNFVDATQHLIQVQGVEDDA